MTQPKPLTIAGIIFLIAVIIGGGLLVWYRGFSYPSKPGWKTYTNYQYGFRIDYMNSCKYEVDRNFGFELDFSDADGGESGLCAGWLDIMQDVSYDQYKKVSTEGMQLTYADNDYSKKVLKEAPDERDRYLRQYKEEHVTMNGTEWSKLTVESRVLAPFETYLTERDGFLFEMALYMDSMNTIKFIR